MNTLLWQEGEHVVVFLKDIEDGISDADHRGLMSEIQTWEEVSSVRYVDKAEAWEEFLRRFWRQAVAEEGAVVKEEGGSGADAVEDAGHALVAKLQEIFAADATDARVATYAELLFGQAQLAEGGQLADPAGFSRKLADVMLDAL